MPRRREVPKRKINPDPKFRNRMVSKFINKMMLRGAKSTSEHALYGAFDIIEQRYKQDPLEVFKNAIENVKPKVEVRSRRVGGATYQVPVEVSKKRRQALAFRWIRTAARARKGIPMAKRLAEELMAAYRREGAAVKIREDTHRMAEANKAFAHLAW